MSHSGKQALSLLEDLAAIQSAKQGRKHLSKLETCCRWSLVRHMAMHGLGLGEAKERTEIILTCMVASSS